LRQNQGCFRDSRRLHQTPIAKRCMFLYPPISAAIKFTDY
jgi:hypothetical protein